MLLGNENSFLTVILKRDIFFPDLWLSKVYSDMLQVWYRNFYGKVGYDFMQTYLINVHTRRHHIIIRVSSDILQD